MAEPAADTSRWTTLEQWSPTVFLLAGVAWLVFVVLAVYETYYLQSADAYLWLTAPLLLLGTAGALVALLGFYPRVSDHAPRATGACAILLAIGLASYLVYTVGNIVESINTGGSFGSTTTVVDYFWIVVLLAILLGFLVLGLVSLRSGVPSRTIGFLMLLPAVALLVHALAGAIIDMPDPVLTEWAVISAVMLAVGYLLRTEPTTADRVESTPTEVRHG